MKKDGDNKLFWSILKAFWTDFVLLILFNVVTTILNLTGPYMIKQLIDFVKTGENVWGITWDPFYFT